MNPPPSTSAMTDSTRAFQSSDPLVPARKPSSEPLIAHLPDALSWREESSIVERAESALENWAYRRLYLWQRHDPAGAVGRLLRLPASSKRRLLQAPRFYVLLSRPGIPTEESWNELTDMVAVESKLIGEPFEGRSPCWSARGDVLVSTGETQLGAAQPGIFIDFESPNVPLSWVVPGLGELTTFHADERAAIQSKIEERLARIAAVSPLAGDFVSTSIKVIAAGKSMVPDAPTASMSAMRNIGLVGLSNLHSQGWNDSSLDEVLVHEAIHSVIYRTELAESLYTDARQAYLQEVVSPWSGRSLQLHSFVHACFVWYGIWSYANLDIASGGFMHESRDRAQHGFLHCAGDASPIPEHICVHLQPAVLAAVEEMTSRVVAGSRT